MQLIHLYDICSYVAGYNYVNIALRLCNFVPASYSLYEDNFALENIATPSNLIWSDHSDSYNSELNSSEALGLRFLLESG